MTLIKTGGHRNALDRKNRKNDQPETQIEL
jgi:hypothetical protein